MVNKTEAELQTENANLLKRVHSLEQKAKEALERQTATAEILKVIASSPSDVQPVFGAITASAERLFDPWQSTIIMRSGNMLEIAAYTPTASPADIDELRKIFPRPFEPGKLMIARSIAECSVFEV